MFDNLFTILKVIAWAVDIYFVGAVLLCVYNMFADGKTTGAAVTLIAGVFVAFLIAVNGGHILINLWLSSIAAWWVGSFFDRDMRPDSDSSSGNSSTAAEDDESWGEFALKHTANILIARSIDREINQAVEDAKKGNDRNGNLHI